MATRVATSSAVYLAVIAAFGGIHSPLAILALPACVLIGVAFAGPMAAYAATRDRDGAFVPVMRFGIVPMFLFSGTFFPISQLPVGIQWIAYCTPLWHGVDLCRTLCLGTAAWWPSIGHVLYLCAWFAVGTWLSERAFTRRLIL